MSFDSRRHYELGQVARASSDNSRWRGVRVEPGNLPIMIGNDWPQHKLMASRVLSLRCPPSVASKVPEPELHVRLSKLQVSRVMRYVQGFLSLKTSHAKLAVGPVPTEGAEYLKYETANSYELLSRVAMQAVIGISVRMGGFVVSCGMGWELEKAKKACPWTPSTSPGLPGRWTFVGISVTFDRMVWPRLRHPACLLQEHNVLLASYCAMRALNMGEELGNLTPVVARAYASLCLTSAADRWLYGRVAPVALPYHVTTNPPSFVVLARD